VNPDRWVRIHTVENIFEMDVIKDLLEREGIDYYMKSFKDTAYDGLFILQKGYAALFVKEKEEEAAKALVKRALSLPYVAFSKD
jgi:hypothetical protein